MVATKAASPRTFSTRWTLVRAHRVQKNCRPYWRLQIRGQNKYYLRMLYLRISTCIQTSFTTKYYRTEGRTCWRTMSWIIRIAISALEITRSVVLVGILEGKYLLVYFDFFQQCFGFAKATNSSKIYLVNTDEPKWFLRFIIYYLTFGKQTIFLMRSLLPVLPILVAVNQNERITGS